MLKAQAVLTVAEETVKERQLVSDQVTALEQNKIKSGLDVSFANVDLAQAQLLLIQAQNNLGSSFAQLSDALGLSDQRTFQLTEQPLPPSPPPDMNELIKEAMADRPELIGQRLNVDSARSYATAERDLWFPTLSAAGVAGVTPEGANQLSPRYAAAGFNLNVPIFNGHLFGALHSEARLERAPKTNPCEIFRIASRAMSAPPGSTRIPPSSASPSPISFWRRRTKRSIWLPRATNSA